MKRRVIQWATGAMGKTCLRAVIDHPDLELVGLYVYGDAKAGRDAGDIARRAPTGVIATRDIDEILALDADVVIHAPRLSPPYGSHDEDILRLLASGKNVISINGYSRPQHWNDARSAALAAACAQGRSSLMAAGLNPGFAGEQLAVVATGVCSRLDHVEIVESVDCRAIRHPDYVFKILGFGADPETVDPNDPAWGPAASLNGMYEEVIAAMAEHLGYRLQAVRTDHAVRGASQDLQIAAGRIPKGGISHVNWRWLGLVDDAPKLAVSIRWYMESAHLETPEPPLWRINVQGSPGVRLTVDLEKSADDTTATSAEQLGVAGAVVNAIPLVCEAAPGLVTRPLATPFRARHRLEGEIVHG